MACYDMGMCMSCLHDAICTIDDDRCLRHDDLAGILVDLPDMPETTAEVVTLVRRWYRLGEMFSVGGPLHVQLDDFNLEDYFVRQEFLDREFLDDWKDTASPEAVEMGTRLLELLRGMDEARRTVAVFAAHYGEVAEHLGLDVAEPTPYP